MSADKTDYAALERRLRRIENAMNIAARTDDAPGYRKALAQQHAVIRQMEAIRPPLVSHFDRWKTS